MTTPTPAQADEKALTRAIHARAITAFPDEVWGVLNKLPLAELKEAFAALAVAAAAIRPEGKAVAWPKDPETGLNDMSLPTLLKMTRADVSPPAPAGAKVKPLDYIRPHGSETLTKADTILGEAIVWTHYEANGSWFWRLGSIASGTEANEADAKKMLWATYEARIRSSLLPPEEAQAQDDVIACLLAEKPFWFDPGTHFVHADDGGGHGVRWAPFDTDTEAQAATPAEALPPYRPEQRIRFKIDGKLGTVKKCWLAVGGYRVLAQTDGEHHRPNKGMRDFPADGVEPAEALPSQSGAEVLTSLWACQAWGDGSSAPGFTNVVCPDCEVVIAADQPIEVAVHIASLHNATLAKPASEPAAEPYAWVRVRDDGRKTFWDTNVGDCKPLYLAKPASEPAGGGVRTGRRAIVHAVVCLGAAISLLERTPKAKKAAPSDRMFDQMLRDYRKALEEASAALSSPASSYPAQAEALPAGVEAVRIKKVAEIIANAAEPDGLGAWEGYADAAREIIASLAKPASPSLRECAGELADLVDDIVAGNYTPDSFTTQPIRRALSPAPAQAGSGDAGDSQMLASARFRPEPGEGGTR